MDQRLTAIEQRIHRLHDIIHVTHDAIPSTQTTQTTRSIDMYTSSVVNPPVTIKKFDRTSIKQLQTEPLKPQLSTIRPVTTYRFDFIDIKPIHIQDGNPFNV